jgi:hypothetical protein
MLISQTPFSSLFYLAKPSETSLASLRRHGARFFANISAEAEILQKSLIWSQYTFFFEEKGRFLRKKRFCIKYVNKMS